MVSLSEQPRSEDHGDGPLRTGKLLPQLESLGIEFDQRMRAAWNLTAETASSDQGYIRDRELFTALCRQNPSYLQYLLPEGKTLEHDPQEVHTGATPPADAGTYPQLRRTLNRALRKLHESHTLGARDFLLALLEDAFEVGDNFARRSFTLDTLTYLYGGYGTAPLSSFPSLRTALELLGSNLKGADDYQYVLMLAGDRVAFRVVSTLGDYVQENNSGLLLPQRAILTHFKDHFGGFTDDEIRELEELLNSKSAREDDFQRYFERHPHFLRRWDHREIYPHVTLSRPEGDLIPDFLLTDRELQRAAIVELKLPTPTLIRRQRNRDRFAAGVMEARTQLLRYRDWFREKHNRMLLKDRIGFEVYEPQLITIIGRSQEFQDEFDRQRLRADNPEIEVVTYDDLVRYADRRRILISP